MTSENVAEITQIGYLVLGTLVLTSGLILALVSLYIGSRLLK